MGLIADVANQNSIQQDHFNSVKSEGLKQGMVFDRVDISCAPPPQFGKNIKFHLDSSFAVKGQQKFVAFSGGNASEKAQELSAQMTEYPIGVVFSMNGLSMEQLAGLVGGIGKEIDSAFAAEEISAEEYAALNKGLDTYADFTVKKAEKERASFSVMKQTAAATKAMIERGASDAEMTDYAERVREKWQNSINEHLEKNAYDRATLNHMIAAVRTGKPVSFHATA